MATAAVRLRQPPPVSPVNYSITTLGALNLEPRHVGRMVEGKNLGIPYLATRCSKLQGAARRLVRWAKKEESIAIDVHKLVLELTDLGETGSCVHFAQRHVPGATPPWGCSPPQHTAQHEGLAKARIVRWGSGSQRPAAGNGSLSAWAALWRSAQVPEIWISA